MTSTTELADRYSRRRAILFAIAAGVFLAIHLIERPFRYSRTTDGIDWWALNAAVLLVAIATGGGLANRKAVRALVNDEVARAHYRDSVHAGFWAMMATAMAIYVLPAFRIHPSRDAVFVVVTTGIGIAMLTFATLELRAHRDA